MYAVELLKYDCVACTAQQKISRGCDQDSPDKYRIEINGEVHKRCPRRPILDEPEFFQELFWLYRQKEKGYLVQTGGLDDQPSFLMEAFKVIDATLSKIEMHRREEQERKRRRAEIRKGVGGSKKSRRRR